MQALGAKEMGGKTGTTNDNADAWFFGYSPQLLAGVWVGCDDRFIRIESAQGYGGTAARPIWQTFFSKVYGDKTLGIVRDAEFVRPADLNNQLINGDVNDLIIDPIDTSGYDATNASDYSDTGEYIPPESQTPEDNDGVIKEKKDTSKNRTKSPKIGDPAPGIKPEEKKKGIFRSIFGGKKDKDKKGEDKTQNDY
jgi:penicillin-binding protein 1A